MLQTQRCSTVSSSSSSSSSSDIHLGLDSLTICSKKSQAETHCDSCMMTSSVVSPSSSSSLIGDYIGMESCFDLDNNNNEKEVCGGGGGGVGVGCRGVKNEDDKYSGFCSQSRGKRQQWCRGMMNRELPPPIPSLAGAENLPSHMPWVLKRYYTSDGRLILREEKVRYNEYFRAHRSNGRLVLHLVAFDDNDDINDFKHQIVHKESKLQEVHQVNVFDNNSNNMNNAEDVHKKTIIVETLLKDKDFLAIEDPIVKCSIAEKLRLRMGLQQIVENA